MELSEGLQCARPAPGGSGHHIMFPCSGCHQHVCGKQEADSWWFRLISATKQLMLSRKQAPRNNCRALVHWGWVGCCDICLYTSEVYEGHALAFRISAFYFFYFTGHHGNTVQVFLFKFALNGASGQLCGLRAHTMWLILQSQIWHVLHVIPRKFSQLANKGRHKKKNTENQSLICLVQYFHYEQGA